MNGDTELKEFKSLTLRTREVIAILPKHQRVDTIFGVGLPCKEHSTLDRGVRYECVSIIKCIIDSKEITKINQLFEDYIARL